MNQVLPILNVALSIMSYNSATQGFEHIRLLQGQCVGGVDFASGPLCLHDVPDDNPRCMAQAVVGRVATAEHDG